ncbi:MAG: carboxypeptidase-like regulatory domain-containing protein [Planctomycetota bacterium]|jgi:hypothetical protein
MSVRSVSWHRKGLGWVLAGLVLGLVLVGCSDGADGQPGQDTAVLSGQVTNKTTSTPVAGAVITTDPVAPGVGNIVADANGDFSVELPIGVYTLTCTDANFVPGEHQISLVAGVPATADFGLVPEAPVIIEITGLTTSVVPGSSFTLNAGVTVMDGSTGVTYQWTQTASAQATIDSPTSATTGITLGNEAAYKAELLSHLEPAGHHWGPFGVNHHSLEEAGHVAFKVTVTTSSGTYTETMDVHADLAFANVATGLRNVPVGRPVLLNNEDQPTFDWAIAAQPGAVQLNDATDANPWFVPDAAGLYRLTVTDEDDGPLTIDIYAGTFEGVIVGQDSKGRPVAQTACTGCHDDTIAPDMFTDWKETGHAEIFTNNYNTSGYWGEGCFDCHTVGYDPNATNGGIDEASDYQAFVGTLHNPSPDNWTNGLANLPDTMQLSNIQCENCHGPQNGPSGQTAHMRGDGSRTSLASEVCARCHGEPLRHARFQQWELSGHGDYEVAQDESWSTRADPGEEFRTCAMCHSANGFIYWVETKDADPDYDPYDEGNEDPDWPGLVSGPDDIHPQTCVTCHDPHDVGTTSGAGTNAPVRIQGDTPVLMAGFPANAVGKGALCMTCHNSRRGMRHDYIDWDALTDKDRATHGGPQTDILMGMNAYFVDVGQRGAHSLIDNTCVKCHLDLTDPPEELSYNLGGTNHTFEASDEICSNCHGAFTADTTKDATEAALLQLEELLVQSIYNEIGKLIAEGNDVHVDVSFDDNDNFVSSTLIDDIDDIDMNTDGTPKIELTEYHGRQAMNITVNGTVVTNVQMAGDTKVVGQGNTPDVDDPTLLDGDNGEILGKAGWNYWLVHSDGSHGIHNPSFTNAVLVNAVIELFVMDFTPQP